MIVFILIQYVYLPTRHRSSRHFFVSLPPFFLSMMNIEYITQLLSSTLYKDWLRFLTNLDELVNSFVTIDPWMASKGLLFKRRLNVK